MNDYEYMSQYLDYEPETGILRWKNLNSNKCRNGDIVGSKDNKGYMLITFNKKTFRAHRLAWFIYHKYIPLEIDHINGIRDDNRIENLRDCTKLQNKQNTRVADKNNKSGYLGVETIKDGKYRATISKNWKKVYLGIFNNPFDAHKAYLIAKKELHEFSTISQNLDGNFT